MLIAENILWLLVLIGVMILIHELGHFWWRASLTCGWKPSVSASAAACSASGEARRISGFPPSPSADTSRWRASSRAKRLPTIRARSMAKPRWQRLLIVFAGPFMNIVLAVALLAGLFMFKYPKPLTADLVAVIGHVMPDSPAAESRNPGRRPHREDRRHSRTPPGKTSRSRNSPAPTGPCSSRWSERTGVLDDGGAHAGRESRRGLCRLGAAGGDPGGRGQPGACPPKRRGYGPATCY